MIAAFSIVLCLSRLSVFDDTLIVAASRTTKVARRLIRTQSHLKLLAHIFSLLFGRTHSSILTCNFINFSNHAAPNIDVSSMAEGEGEVDEWLQSNSSWPTLHLFTKATETNIAQILGAFLVDLLFFDISGHGIQPPPAVLREALFDGRETKRPRDDVTYIYKEAPSLSASGLFWYMATLDSVDIMGMMFNQC